LSALVTWAATGQPDAIVPSNAYHALIILPEAEEQEFIDAQNEHAVDLAMAARWLPRL
jgi:hypothetical protein